MDDHLAPYTDILLLLRQWENGLQKENAPQLLQLRQFDLTEISSAISAILAFADVDMRLIAVEALPHIVPLDVMIELLIPALADTRSSVRWSVCKIFERYPDPRVVQAIIGVLQTDENPHVRVVAADVLCEIGDVQALAALSYAAEHDLEKNYEGRTVASAAGEAMASIQERMMRDGPGHE